MTYKQAIQKARETAMQSGRTQIVYWFKPHWWSFRRYSYMDFRVYAVNGDLDGFYVASMVYPDGKLH